MASEDLLCAVELFEQHASDQQMRPGHRAEREDHVCTVENCPVEAIGPADRKDQLGPTLVAPGGDPFGQCATRPLAAPLVERDERDAGRQRATD